MSAFIWLGQYASSSHTTMVMPNSVFHDQCQYSLHPAVQGWPGWVNVGGWLNNKIMMVQMQLKPVNHHPSLYWLSLRWNIFIDWEFSTLPNYHQYPVTASKSAEQNVYHVTKSVVWFVTARCLDRRGNIFKELDLPPWCYAAADKHQVIHCCRNGTFCNKHLHPTFSGKFQLL